MIAYGTPEPNSQPEGKLFDKEDRLRWFVPDVARKLGVSDNTIRLMVYRDAIPSHKRGRRRYFLPDEIEAWLRTDKGATYAKR